MSYPGPPAAHARKSADDEHESYVWGRRSATIYQVRLSILYHLKRERHYDNLDKFCSGITAVAATAAAAVLLKKVESLELVFALFTAVLSLIPLVINPADKARKHSQAAAEYRRLLADCEREGVRWSETDCNLFAARVIELEASEPLPLNALVIDCQNQIAIAAGDPMVPLSRFQSLAKHWLDFDAALLGERIRQAEEAAREADEKASSGEGC